MNRAGIRTAVNADLVAAFGATHVVFDDFSEAATAAIEESLRVHGYVIITNPIDATDLLDQADKRSAELALVSVDIRTLQGFVGAPTADAAVDTAIGAVLGDRTLRARLAKNATTLLKGDRPRLSYTINFTVPIIP